MKIFQFMAEYCQDLIEAAKMKKELVDFTEFPHDTTITDSEGNTIPVVVVDGHDIPVSDFLSLDRADFINAWKSQGAGEAFDNYIGALEILEGEEAVSRIRKAIMAERDRLAQDVELVTEI